MTDYAQPDVVSKRVRFFDGQFLQDQDFVDEQKYHLDRERRVFRALKVTGVVDGLGVSASGGTLTIAPGTAVDALGRVIVLTAAATLRISGAAFSGAAFDLRLVYREAQTDIADVGGLSARRWDETPMVVAVAADGSTLITPDGAGPLRTGPSVLLAQVTAPTGGGPLVVDGTRTQRAGLVVPGSVGIGTPTPIAPLHVQGSNADGIGLHVEGSLRSNSGEGGLWVTQDRFVGGHGDGLVGFYNVTTGWNLVMTRDGHVGLGTQQPDNADGFNRVLDVLGTGTAKLSVRTSGRTGVDARVVAADGASFGSVPGMVVGTKSNHAVSLATAGRTQLTVDTGGHVGIGVPAPQAWLDVFGVGDQAGLPSLLLRAGNGGNGAAGAQIAFADKGSARYRHTIRSRHNSSDSLNALDFYVWSPTTAGGPDGLGDKHVLTMTSGHVGVGTLYPENDDGFGRVLDVLGTGNAKLSVRTTGIDARVVAADGGFYGSDPGMVVGTKSGHPVNLATSSLTRLTVDAGGRVGVATTRPAAAVDVAGLGNGAAALLLRWGNRATQIDNVQLAFSYNNGSQYRHHIRSRHNPGGVAGNSLDFYVWTSDVSSADGFATRQTMSLNGGNVGIGSLEPINEESLDRVVEVLGPSSANITVRTPSVQARIIAHDFGIFGSPTTGSMVVGTKSVHPLSLVTGGATRLTVDTAGNVGIGTTTPAVGGWSRALSIAGAGSSALYVRADAVTARMGAWGTTTYRSEDAGVYVGAESAHSLQLQTSGLTRLTVDAGGAVSTAGNLSVGWDLSVGGAMAVRGTLSASADLLAAKAVATKDSVLADKDVRAKGDVSADGNVSAGNALGGQNLSVRGNAIVGALGVGTTTPSAPVNVVGDSGHLRLERVGNPNEANNNGKLLLELLQRDYKVNYPFYMPLNIGFRQENGYSQRIQASVDGFTLLTGDVGATSGYSSLTLGGLTALGEANIGGALRLNCSAYPSGSRQVVVASNRGLEFRYGSASDPMVNDLSQIFLANVNYTGRLVANSDARLKADVVELDAALERVCRLRGVTYVWNDAGRDVLSTGEPDGTRQVGVLAQDVQAVLPELVVVGADGYLGVDYPKLTAVLVQAVKEQQAVLTALQSRVTAVEAGPARPHDEGAQHA